MRTVLHYSIQGRLGAGGMGVVYRALDTRLDRVVALKFLPDDVAADAEARRRLVSEARAAARLDHPNIGAIYGIEGVDAEPFIVMAFYPGETLAERLRAGPLTIADVVAYGLQAARGLDRAHQHGITHRDVKPANLLITPEGVVKVLDFGLARQEALEGVTRTGHVVGTPAYLAPEQARGQAVDGRADLWALGTVLYEMLTGVSPFHADAGLVATLLRIVRDEPEPLERLRPEVPPALQAIVQRALCKERDERYASAGQMIADLEALAPTLAHHAAASAPAAAAPVVPASTSPAGRPSHLPPATVAPAGATRTPPPFKPPAVPPPAVPPPAVTLPAPAGALVGRQDELALAHLHLADPHCRVLTLFGPGGTGKTRLAIELARDVARDDPSAAAVHFVALDALQDPSQIAGAVASTLQLTLHGDGDVIMQVQRAIGSTTLLLVLDNFEHLMDGAAIVAELVAACPELTLLVTSRERLNLEEEWVLPIAGLGVPPAEVPADREQAMQYESVALFVQRAQRSDVRFGLDDDVTPHVFEICRLVQGLPLGVELAAAWVKSVGCSEIAHELRSNLDFLESSSRNVSERHRSLRAAFDYSWRLLTPDQRRLLAALSVFRGGFTRDAARAVTGASVRQLVALADKSLLELSSTGRYDLHPLVHQFAAERLAEGTADGPRLRDAHGRSFHQLLQAREADLAGRGHREAYAALAADEGNLRAAWQWAVEGPHADVLLASARPLEGMFDVKGRHLEVAALFGEAVAGVDDADGRHHEALGVMSVHQAWAYYSLGRLPEARAAAERGLAWLRPSGEGIHLLKALNTLAAIAYGAGSYADARELWTEALGLARKLGNPRFVGTVLGNVAAAERSLGEYDASRGHQQEALALAREVDDPAGIISALVNLSAHGVRTGALAEARAQIEEALDLAREVGFDTMLPTLVHSLGVVHYEQRAYAEALTNYREALRLAEELGDEHRQAYALTSIGAAHIALGDFAEAAARLADALRLAWANEDLPTALQGIRWLAQLHAEQGRVAEAISLATMVERHPAADRGAIDVNLDAVAAWAATLTPDELAAASARGAGLQLEEVVARSLRELGAAASAVG